MRCPRNRPARPPRLEPLEPRDVPAGPTYQILPAPTGPALPPARSEPPAPGGQAPGPRDGPLDLSQTFRLHSHPTANHVIYLDFDGHVTVGTQWNTDFGLDAIVTPAYDPAGDGPAFSSSELERIQYVWQRVAEDFSPFDVDVTTEDPGVDRLENTGAGDTHWGVRVAIGGDGSGFLEHVGGVAYVGSFTWASDTPAFVFSANLHKADEKDTADGIAHETGHTLGLSHDGQGPNEYYAGHGFGPTGWAPIMGVGYYRQLTQWSRGEYAGATNHQDDLAVITTRNGFGYRPDDHGSTLQSATPAILEGPTRIRGSGVIERRADADCFRFRAGPGTVTLTVNPAARGPDLDVRAELFNAAGRLLAVANPTGALNATIQVSVPGGSYFLKIDGVGQGTADTGYTDYASLGQYTFTGVIPAPRLPTGWLRGAAPLALGPVAWPVAGVTAAPPVVQSDRAVTLPLPPPAPATGELPLFVTPAPGPGTPIALDPSGDGTPGADGDPLAATV